MDKSNHKKAWQTAQRALQTARDAEAIMRASAPSKPTRMQTAFKATAWIFGTLIVGGLSLTATVYQLFGGPPWPTPPIFSPQLPSNASPFGNPFDVSNKSGLADIHDLSIKCQIVYLKSERLTVTKDFPGRLIFDAQGSNPLLEAGAPPQQFTCPFAQGLDNVGLGSSALNNPQEARIALVANYRTPFWWPPSWLRAKREAPPAIFTLDTKTSPPRWTIPLQ